MVLQILEDILFASLVINCSILLLWTAAFSLFKKEVVKAQKFFIDVEAKDITATIYLLLGIYKILIIFFNLIPYLAILIIS